VAKRAVAIREDQIERSILVIRGQKVILDTDLALIQHGKIAVAGTVRGPAPPPATKPRPRILPAISLHCP
jgi:hypothetical protein